LKIVVCDVFAVDSPFGVSVSNVDGAIDDRLIVDGAIDDMSDRKSDISVSTGQNMVSSICGAPVGTTGLWSSEKDWPPVWDEKDMC
jgi:hypothetical protein